MINGFEEIVLNFMPMWYGKYNKDSNIGKLLTVIGEQWEDIANTLNDLENLLDIDQASGNNLDIHAANKNFKRLNLTDEELRIRLKLETRVNNSRGTLSEVEEIARTIFGDNSYNGIKEKYQIDSTGAGILLSLVNITDPTIKIENPTFQRALVAGVNVDYEIVNQLQTIGIEGKEVFYYINKVLEVGNPNTYCASEMGVMF